MKLGIKLRLIRCISKFLLKIGGRSLSSHSSPFLPLIYKTADLVLKGAGLESEIFEIQGFKIKRGRTTRLLILTGESPEQSTIALIKNEVKNGMHVFDLGANIGWFTLIFSKLIGDSGHVYAFEPDPYTFKILEENIELNKLKNVSIFQLAVSNKVGVAKFHLVKNQDAANVLESKTKTDNCLDVKTTTLDEFCTDHNTKIDFLKMDVEGSEPKVFEGMKNVIVANPKIKIISEFYPIGIIDVGSSPEDYLNSLELAGFIINQIDEKNLGKFKPAQKEELLRSRKFSFNVYCYRP